MGNSIAGSDVVDLDFFNPANEGSASGFANLDEGLNKISALADLVIRCTGGLVALLLRLPAPAPGNTNPPPTD